MSNDIIITRLREANPVRSSAVADAEVMFETITAAPPDPRFGPRRSTRRTGRRRALTIALVGALMALLASTAYAAYQELYSAPVVDPKVTKREYERASHQLTLPPGKSWPDFHMPPDTVTSQGGGGSQAVRVSQHAWECYWVAAITSGDTAAQRRAHGELQAILDHNVFVAPQGASESWAPRPAPDAPYAIYAPDGGFEYVQKMYDMAAAGHPERLKQSCIVNG